MEWKTTCALMAGLSAALVVALLFAPDLLWWLFGVEGMADGDFAFRRAGLLFVILGLVAWAMRTLPPSALRARLAFAYGVGMVGFVVLGLAEVLRGFAGLGMLVAVVAETGFAALFLRHWLRDRHHPDEV